MKSDNEVRTRSLLFRKADGDNLPIWNYLHVADLLKPKVLVCKAGRFLDKFDHLIGSWTDGDLKTNPLPHDYDHKFENAAFEQSCDPLDITRRTKASDLGISGSEGGETDNENDAIVVQNVNRASNLSSAGILPRIRRPVSR